MAEYKSNYTGEQIDTAIGKANTALQAETDPIFSASASANITTNDISNWNGKAETSDIPDVSNFITKDVNNLTNYELKTATGNNILVSINSDTYVMTMSLRNSNNEVLNTQTVDLPLETMVVGGSYDNVNRKIVLTLKNGNTIDVPVGDLINGLQSEITSTNKLDASLVDDSLSTNKFVTSAEKTTWGAKYDKPATGIPKTDLAQAVQDSLDLADSAIQSNDLASVATSGDYEDLSNKPTIPDTSLFEVLSNKVTSILSSSTDTQYPSAKSVFDFLQNTIKAYGKFGTLSNSGSGGATDYTTFPEVGTYVFANNEVASFNWKYNGSSYYTMDYGVPLLAFVFNQSIMYFITIKTTGNYGVYKVTKGGTKGLIFTRVRWNSSQHSGEDDYFKIMTLYNQSFSGIKTFSDIPQQSNTTAPTLDTQFTNKKYVDDSIAAAITTTLGGSY